MKKYKYRYFKSFNGKTSEAFTNDLNTANNNSYYCGMPYFIIDNDKELEVRPDFILTDNLIDKGFHNPIIRKNNVTQ